MQSKVDLENIISHCSSVTIKQAKDCYNTSSEQLIVEASRDDIFFRFALQGGQLLECAINNQPVLWLSPSAIFNGHSAIRGGIPVCLPWFGVNQNNTSLPKHGFVRNSEWHLNSIKETNAAIEFELTFTSLKHELFEAAFSCVLRYRISNKIGAYFSITNLSDSEEEFSYALHSYFKVEDSLKASVTGLDNTTYLDNLDQLQAKQASGPITFTKEVDRAYIDCPAEQQLNASKSLTVTATSMPTAIVWNPNESAKSIADIGEAYRQYICLERGAAFENSLRLAPKLTYQAHMVISPN